MSPPSLIRPHAILKAAVEEEAKEGQQQQQGTDGYDDGAADKAALDGEEELLDMSASSLVSGSDVNLAEGIVLLETNGVRLLPVRSCLFSLHSVTFHTVDLLSLSSLSLSFPMSPPVRQSSKRKTRSQTASADGASAAAASNSQLPAAKRRKGTATRAQDAQAAATDAATVAAGRSATATAPAVAAVTPSVAVAYLPWFPSHDARAVGSKDGTTGRAAAHQF
jgi:cytoskeletal protein RodZ